jgi:hypothetical protein
MRQQSGLGIAGEDAAFDTDDGDDMGMPVGVGQFVGGIEDGDGTAFVAVAAAVVAVCRPARRRGLGDLPDLMQQSRLIALDLDDQGELGLGGDLEVFF